MTLKILNDREFVEVVVDSSHYRTLDFAEKSWGDRLRPLCNSFMHNLLDYFCEE
jgi:hypothetical protein